MGLLETMAHFEGSSDGDPFCNFSILVVNVNFIAFQKKIVPNSLIYTNHFFLQKKKHNLKPVFSFFH